MKGVRETYLGILVDGDDDLVTLADHGSTVRFWQQEWLLLTPADLEQRTPNPIYLCDTREKREERTLIHLL